MKKIWAYTLGGIAVLLLGLVIGLYIAVRNAGDTYSAYIKRIRQKGKEGADQDVVFTPILNGIDKTKSRIERKKERLEKKFERKNKRR